MCHEMMPLSFDAVQRLATCSPMQVSSVSIAALGSAFFEMTRVSSPYSPWSRILENKPYE
jgi:hypothetical protein